MKKTIVMIAMVVVATQLHATDLGDMVSRMAHDLNIKVVKINNRHAREHRAHSRSHVHKKVIRHRKHQTRPQIKSTKHSKIHKLNFHSLSEYKRIANRHHHKTHRSKIHHSRKSLVKHGRHNGTRSLSHYVGNGWYGDDDGYYNEKWEDIDYRDDRSWNRHRVHKQHGYRHYRRQWYLTYLYERSSFYDSYGFYYGDFDRYGFMFDGRWYGYDYNYTYQDRLHGKGIFKHRYYRPISYRYTSMDDFWDDDEWHGNGHLSFRVSFK